MKEKATWATKVIFFTVRKNHKKMDPLVVQDFPSVKRMIDTGIGSICMKVFCLSEHPELEIGFITRLACREETIVGWVPTAIIFTSEIKKMEKKDGFWEVITEDGVTYRVIT